MGFKFQYLFLVLLISCITGYAKSSTTANIVVIQEDNKKDSEITGVVLRNEQICTLCEEFTAKAIYYLAQNQTQSQIISNLHQVCSRLHSFQKQCILLVDYYAPLIFLEATMIQPEQFCEKVNLCQTSVFLHLPSSDQSCSLCHHLVEEILTKLQDPDAQLEIIELLLKGCNKIENHVQQCKKLVFQYGPLILANAEKFFEATDICTTIHACKESQELDRSNVATA